MDYTDLGAMATATFNAIYAGDPEIAPVECLADIERGWQAPGFRGLSSPSCASW